MLLAQTTKVPMRQYSLYLHGYEYYPGTDVISARV